VLWLGCSVLRAAAGGGGLAEHRHTLSGPAAAAQGCWTLPQQRSLQKLEARSRRRATAAVEPLARERAVAVQRFRTQDAASTILIANRMASASPRLIGHPRRHGGGPTPCRGAGLSAGLGSLRCGSARVCCRDASLRTRNVRPCSALPSSVRVPRAAAAVPRALLSAAVAPPAPFQSAASCLRIDGPAAFRSFAIPTAPCTPPSLAHHPPSSSSRPLTPPYTLSTAPFSSFAAPP
jgi:hypothetical protein